MNTNRVLRFLFPGRSWSRLRSHVRPFGTERSSRSSFDDLDWRSGLKTTVAAVTAVGTVIAAIGTVSTAKAVKDHRKAEEASRMYGNYPEVGKCLAEIAYFYEDREKRRRRKNAEKKTDSAEKKPDSAEKKPDSADQSSEQEKQEKQKKRESLALEWAEEKKSMLSDEVKRVDECRRVTKNFFENAYRLLERNLVDKDVFEESFYAHSGNFKRLVEPLDKANFKLVNTTEAYEDGSNRPRIYITIEEAASNPATKGYFGDLRS
ncbi:uncharacterized protein LOC134189422 [Corticium candelabrum]|uniref:uncharacterized protein LOC134189422 n=1 Tax=Corticium candelabrum TaxID=121492 RepID=UPI002E273F4A|nr:uncharacterized protein LOC134189422 [Corticium candelabrum]XP_062513666.1 uncharacterized protein LOC134189422 [Corticium candelabrum]